jgi:hypothetical protein
MAILANARPAAAAQVKLFQAPPGQRVSAALNIVNTNAAGGADATVNVWGLAVDGTPTDANRLVPTSYAMPAGGDPKRFAIVLEAGNVLYVSSSTGTVNFHVLGVQIPVGN